VVQRAGLAVELLSANLLPKELIAVLSRAPAPAPAAAGSVPPADLVARRFALIGEVREAARRAAASGQTFGIMGSSIVACWLMLELETG